MLAVQLSLAGGKTQMHDFDYCAPDNLQEALALMGTHGNGARLLAGGTDLIVMMRAGRQRPALVIDGKKIPELANISLDHSGLSLGAAVSCRSLSEHPEVARIFPALVDSTTLIGGIQIQGRATVGGNLCNAAPSADTIPPLIVHGAVANIASAAGSRQVPVDEFCVAPGQTVLEDGEILVSIFIPAPAAHTGARFLRFIPRAEMDIAVANVAALVELDEAGDRVRDARIAIGAVAPTPVFAKDAGASLVGKPISDDAIATAARIARDASRPIDDMRGTVEHRKQLVEVLARRALEGALARARGETA